MTSSIKLTNGVVEFQVYSSSGKSSGLANMIGLNRKKRFFRSLDNINLEFKTGDRVALLGKNGAGKSTLLKVLSGFLPCSSGSLDIVGSVHPALTPAPSILRTATCLQNIHLQGFYLGFKGEKLKEYVDAVCEFAQLGDFIYSPYDVLSAGMKSRFSVATMSFIKPEILLMDEWVGAADKLVLERQNGLLAKAISQCDIFVLASHRKDLVRYHCERGIVLQDGKVVFDGDVDDALKEIK